MPGSPRARGEPRALDALPRPAAGRSPPFPSIVEGGRPPPTRTPRSTWLHRPTVPGEGQSRGPAGKSQRIPPRPPRRSPTPTPSTPAPTDAPRPPPGRGTPAARRPRSRRAAVILVEPNPPSRRRQRDQIGRQPPVVCDLQVAVAQGQGIGEHDDAPSAKELLEGDRH